MVDSAETPSTHFSALVWLVCAILKMLLHFKIEIFSMLATLFISKWQSMDDS